MSHQSFATFQSFIKPKRAFPGPWLSREHLARSLESLMRQSGNRPCGAEIRESHLQARRAQDHQCGEKRRSDPFPHRKKSLPRLPTPSPHIHSSSHRASATPQPRPRCGTGRGLRHLPAPGEPPSTPAAASPPPRPARCRPGRLLLPLTATTGAAPGRPPPLHPRGPRRSPTPTSGTSLPPSPGLAAAAAPGRA